MAYGQGGNRIDFVIAILSKQLVQLLGNNGRIVAKRLRMIVNIKG